MLESAFVCILWPWQHLVLKPGETIGRLTAYMNEAPAYPIIWRLAPSMSEARQQQQPRITCQQAGLTQNVWHASDAAQQRALTRKAVAAWNIRHSMGNYVYLADQAIIKPAEVQEDVFAPGVTIYKSPACKSKQAKFIIRLQHKHGARFI